MSFSNHAYLDIRFLRGKTYYLVVQLITRLWASRVDLGYAAVNPTCGHLICGYTRP